MALHNNDSLEDVIKWRQVFISTATGREVLAEILLNAKFFENGEDEQDLVLQNFAKWIIFKLGIYSDATILDVIDKLSEVDYTKTEVV